MIDPTNKTTRSVSKTAAGVSLITRQSSSGNTQRNKGGSLSTMLTNNYVVNNNSNSGNMRMSIK